MYCAPVKIADTAFVTSSLSWRHRGPENRKVVHRFAPFCEELGEGVVVTW